MCLQEEVIIYCVPCALVGLCQCVPCALVGLCQRVLCAHLRCACNTCAHAGCACVGCADMWITGPRPTTSVVSPTQSKYLVKGARETGVALAGASKDKREKHQARCEVAGISFVPLAVETLGVKWPGRPSVGSPGSSRGTRHERRARFSVTPSNGSASSSCEATPPSSPPDSPWRVQTSSDPCKGDTW